MSWLRWFHTIRYLRPVQVVGRVTFRLIRPVPDLSPAPPLRPGGRAWVSPAARRSSLLELWRFRFLNETHELTLASDWDNPDWSKLWRYNLHYFDDLNAEDAPARAEWHRQWLERWVMDNAPGQGSGWEPYPTSLRIVNWVKWALAGNTLPESVRQSLAVQARWLTKRLENHLLGNHLFSNGKALLFAGHYFEGEEAENWLRLGLRILEREVPEQILADGGQFERSPMYHALALEDMLDLSNLIAAYEGVLDVRKQALLVDWRQRMETMRRWLGVMCHPDGEVSFFNDSAIGIAPAPSELERYARDVSGCEMLMPGGPITALPDSGYVRVEKGEMVAHLDVAPVGPDYLPGHAHADTLSFECSLFGQRLVVNSGTSVYGTDDERQRQRGTPAHSTVTINGTDSSEVWSGFRVARRARPVGLSLDEGPDGVEVHCAHDGYRRLPGRPLHRRTWQFMDTKLSVIDSIEGRFEDAVAHFYLHPDVSVEQASAGDSGWFSLANGQRCQWQVVGGEATVSDSTWHPEFGKVVANRCLVVRFTNARCQVTFDWS